MATLHTFQQNIQQPKNAITDAAGSTVTKDVAVVVDTDKPQYLVIAALEQLLGALQQSEWPAL